MAGIGEGVGELDGSGAGVPGLAAAPAGSPDLSDCDPASEVASWPLSVLCALVSSGPEQEV